MGTIFVFGIEVDESRAEYLILVAKYARSAHSDEHEVRRRALNNLGRVGCKKALFCLVDRYANSNDVDEREVRSKAFECLEKVDGL